MSRLSITFTLAFLCYCGVNFLYFPIDTIFGDENRFLLESIKLSETGEFWKSTYRAWEMPLTAIIYSAFYTLLESKEGLIISVRLLQSILLLLQGYLAYQISLKIFKNPTIAFLTLITVLFYPYFVFYQGLLLSENIFITILVAAFYFIYSWYEKGLTIDRYFVFANIFLTLTLYSKGTLSYLPPLLMVGFYFFNRFTIRDSLKILAYSLVIYMVTMSPWWIRNYMIFDKFVPFTTSSGMNFYLGNNPHNLTGGCDWKSDVDIDIVNKMFAIEDELEENDTFKQEAIRFIKKNPDRFLELAWLKLKRFYSIVPNASQFSKGKYKYISILSYGVVFILAIISMLYHIRYWQKLSAMYILFLYFTLIHVVFIASLRYRLPVEIFMIILATPIPYYIYQKINSKNG
jgi:hypothetical protein